MDICGEHGDDIAYMGRDCPACGQIEDLQTEHRNEITDLEFSHAEEVDSLQDQIDELENK